jgi:uncharacterized protein YcfJ|tara:strand:- start:782 stop:1165 length:384 start_codon:yes stop_codon:yes gene_type:complete
MNTFTTTASIVLLFTTAGCSQWGGGTNGALLGGGIGALAGQAIGHDTNSTLIGAGAGALGGMIIGNEIERQDQLKRDYERQQREENGYTTRTTNTRVIMNPDGTYTRTGTETTESTVRTPGYSGLPY